MFPVITRYIDGQYIKRGQPVRVADPKQIQELEKNARKIINRLGYPFKQNVHYAAGDGKRAKKLQKINYDLYVEQLDFRIEVKYLKNWISSADTRAASKNWSALQQDFDWIMDEIENGKRERLLL